MNRTLLSTKNFYNIAMAVGTSLDLHTSLCTTLQEIVRAFDGAYAAIVLAQWEHDQLGGAHKICIYPPEATALPESREVIARVKTLLREQTLHGLDLMKPRQELLSDGSYNYWFPLPKHGILILSLGNKQIPETEIAKMVLICHKISQAIDQALLHQQTCSDLAVANAKYQTSSRMIDEFLAAVSHELYTPLALIMGFTETLLDGRPGSLTATQQRFLDNSYKSSERMLQTVNDLLTIARIQQKQIQFEAYSLYPNELVDSLVTKMQGLATQKGINLSLENEWPPEIVCMGDQHWLGKIIIQLITNAVKFTPTAERVLVQSDYSDNTWVFSVTNAGAGIPPDELPFAFDKFYRGQQAKTSQSPGLGIGLSICKAVIEAHHGEIGIRNNPNGGTTAWFKLPAILSQ